MNMYHGVNGTQFRDSSKCPAENKKDLLRSSPGRPSGVYDPVRVSSFTML